jgi:hypothetical protein
MAPRLGHKIGGPRGTRHPTESSWSFATRPLANVDVEPQHTKMSDMPSREEIDAKIGAAEARGDTKIARIEGKLDLVISKLAEVQESGRATRGTLWAIGLGLAALILAVAFGVPAIYTLGTQTRDIVRDEVKAALPAPPQPAPGAK